LDTAIKSKLGKHRTDKEVEEELEDLFPSAEDLLGDDDTDDGFEPFEPEAAMPEADEWTPESFDTYLTAEVLLPLHGELTRARVTGRKRGADGNPIGKANANPILDSREYEVKFHDGSTETFAANVIAESLYSQVDSDGRELVLMQGIIDHRSDGSAVPMDDYEYVTPQGTRRTRMTTKGWELLVEWKGGGTDWIPLKDMKEAYPVETAEYAVANKIAEQPAFAWWVRHALRTRDRMIKKVKSRYWKRTHKYGIELPKSVKEALAVDANSGTTFWKDAIEMEMKNVMPAFEFRDDDKMPIGYQKIDCHMIFDVKLDLVRKARFVAGGHQTDVPSESVYSSYVSRDSVRIAFLIAALNDLDILAADVQNAYLNAPTKERLYTIAGPEFGPSKAGRPVLIVRALYGLRSSGARFHDHMAATLREGGFTACKADADVWMKAAVKEDGTPYYEYVLCYCDDLLAISANPQAIMDYLKTKYTLKNNSVAEPTVYLGAKVSKHYIAESDEPTKPRWSLSAEDYVKRAVKDVETELHKEDKVLPTKVSTPCSTDYRPELDQSKELDEERASYYAGLIGVLRWCIELGRIDIFVEVSLLSRFLANPREGHLQQAFHIFGYLKRHERSKMVFDDTEPVIDQQRFKQVDWSEFYPDAAEPMPTNVPAPRGRSVVTSCFVDADHAGCRATRRSHTGVLIFVNNAPILWFSKRQNTVESSTFGSEYVALRTAIDLVEGLRYKLRMMGVPFEGPTSIFCDNEGVVKNTTAPESPLKKKHVAICYHRCREAQAAGFVQIAKEDTKTNLADALTKPLPGARRRELLQGVLW
jgi:Reverse transcriptase (RNA-dependent DNA polymerase)